MNPFRKLLRRKRRKEPPRPPASKDLNVFRSAGPSAKGVKTIQAKQMWLVLHGGSHPLTRARGEVLRKLVR